ncbi:lamin tail domain-containing protein [Aquibacillus rhizosphaerae]|uniref:Lamin tail domain-containing protein n=1 Tax=Aquibacillus rhizosphaerae TaxID=3051431 RepID=A0ABT7L9Z0_9BACI|nr:lamin tail domain-containing protein [Aquibacillus sp. LR5S19]MDL4842672.1 lamin tail domain-containing protein [Aquibacillus sp. LR5S19]
MRKQRLKTNVTKTLSLILIFSVLFMDVVSVFPMTKVSAATATATATTVNPNLNGEDVNHNTDEISKVETQQESIIINEELDAEADTQDPELDNQTNPTPNQVEENVESKEESATAESEVETIPDNEPSVSSEKATITNDKEIDQKPLEVQEEEAKQVIEQDESEQLVEEIDFDSLPALLITEIMANNDGADDYEYFEVYNNSDRSIILDHHIFSLRYTDGSGNEDVAMSFSPVAIEPKQTLVFWRNASNHTIADFNSHYKTNLLESDIVEYSSTGFYNSGNRAVVIKKANGEEIALANYLPEDIASGKVVNYQYPITGTEMAEFETLAVPNPGYVAKEQLPEAEVTTTEHQPPVINHESLTEIEAGKDVQIEAEITDDGNDISAKLYYQTSNNESFKSLEMKHKEDKLFQAIISGNELLGETVSYYISVSDANHRVTFPNTTNTYVEVPISQPEEENFDTYPHLLITELSPNSKGGGTDYYEYFELYNNTNQTLPLNNYTFVYRYTDTNKEVVFQIPTTSIDSKETLVFWYNNDGRSLSDFNNNFGSDLTSDQVVEVTDSNFPGFANGGNRALVLKDNQSETVIQADYLGTDNDNSGAVIEYQYPREGIDMINYRSMATPTPGVTESGQVPDQVVVIPEIEEDTEAPEITHTAIKEADAFSNITIEATITDNMAIPTATLYVKGEGDQQFTSLAMRVNPNNANNYSVEIPGAFIKSNITYYMEATDGENVSKSEDYIIEVIKDEVDPEQVPGLLVTEVVPDTDNVGSADGYEFIEIYNNTDQAINFKDYKIQYRYGSDPESDIIWPSIPDDVVIPSKETLVFWIINGQNDAQTVADFNANFGTSLIENQDIVKIYSAGMANGSMRGLIVATNTDQELSVAYYNDVENIDDTQPNKGIVYKYPTDGTNQMEKVSAGITNATPGSVESFQVPKQQVSLPVDEMEPTIENLTDIIEINQTEDINLKADVKDNIQVKTVQVYYRANDQEQYQQALLEEDYDDMMYHYRIYSPEIIAKDYVDYYFVASDGTNEVTSDVYRINVTNDLDNSSLRVNIKQDEILNGTSVIKGTSNQDNPGNIKLSIDDQDVEEDTFQAVEHQAYLAFEVSGVNTYFQNGVTIGDEIVHIFDDWIAQWQTITVPIKPDQLQVGNNTLTIRAGNKATPWEGDPGENRDDYNLRNVRLVLSDGTILTDETHQNPSEVFDMGDDGTDRIAEDFIFTITDQLAQSKAYLWDTTTATDGKHLITVTDSDEEKLTNVFVDNTAPSISTNIKEEKEYKGSFSIEATITDAIAGVESSTIFLDEEEITVPYHTSSGKLTAGNHKVTIKAVDKAGNAVTEIVHFSVVNENPEKPGNALPNQGEPIEDDPVLKVNVFDPTGDELDVAFYQGYQYKPSDTIDSYSGASDVEPPNTPTSDTEVLFDEEDILSTSKLDGDYMVTDSTTQFPYHRFDVTVDPTVDENDIVEFVWNGNSLPGRKVTMYAWNQRTSEWVIVDYKIAGDEDFELKGTVSVNDFVKDNKINVIVQDEIPNSPEEYDYTFVWMSDTQYYSESYPYIYDRQTQWIVEKQEEMKIKYVMHTGDLVDESDKEYQWKHADDFMKTLDDANVPYGVLAGNHDVSQKTNDYTAYYEYFGADRFEEKPYYGGSYLNNRGHYDLISVNGNDYIMVYLGWGVEDEGIAWMNEVLAAHPDRMAILNFHEYMQATGTRHPLGEKLYDEVVEPNENVIAVLSGHYHESQLLVDEIDDDGDGTIDRSVYQMLADYQAGPEGGQGYMRLLHFDTDNDRIIVNTYSPYMDDYNYYDTDAYPGKDEFVLNLDLAAKEKRVATDYFAVNIYTDTQIGSVENVPSGETAEIIWTGLEEGKTYSWYTVISDQYSGETTSDIWTFVKGKDKKVDETPPPVDEEEEQPETPGNPTQPSDGGENQSPNDQPDNGDNQSEELEEIQETTNSSNDETVGEVVKINDGGDTLAETATNMYNLIISGIIILIMGLAMIVYNRRKRIFSKR